MKTFIIDKKEIKNLRYLIRNDIAVLLKEKEVFAIGAEFLGAPQGIVVWSEDGSDACRIKYIFVTQECRRVGIGTALIRAMCEELAKKGIHEAGYSYSGQDNRRSLTPFLEMVGGVSFEKEFPYGSVSVTAMVEVMEQNHISGPTKALGVDDLTFSQKSSVDKFINEHTQLDLSDYTKDDLCSFVMSGDSVKAMMLVDRESDIIHIDYMITEKSTMAMAEMLKRFHSLISEIEKPDETYIDMVLSTPDAAKLYEKVGGGRDAISLISGFIDTDMVAEDAMMAKLYGELDD